jgi:RNA polymerase sigma-70 factor (ECF subfamily)
MSYSSSELLAALPRLRRYACFLVDDPAHADDIVAKTLERARAAVGADAARSQCFELLALLRSVHAEERAGLSQAPPPRNADSASRPEEAAAGAADVRARQVLQELRRLPVEQREVVVLVAVERMSYEEIATLLQVPVATVLSWLQQARGVLRSTAIGRTSAQGGQLR